MWFEASHFAAAGIQNDAGEDGMLRKLHNEGSLLEWGF